MFKNNLTIILNINFSSLQFFLKSCIARFVLSEKKRVHDLTRPRTIDYSQNKIDLSISFAEHH
jgi:hypothetical protein